MVAVAAPRLSHANPTAAPARLRPPSLRPGLVDRQQLQARLDALTQHRLTVVVAPTGYGKTTLVARWAESEARPLAWLTLGPAVGTPSTVWSLVGAALERTVPDLSDALPAGASSGRSGEEQARLLAGGLGGLDRELVLVIDGYEHLAAPGSGPSLERFLELAPEGLHVVLSTREEPDLRLALRRARGELGELRADDLRLSSAEVGEIVRRTSGLVLGAADAAELADRTEGWPAAVYLAALAARTSARPLDVLRCFSGARRDVADYLRAELLDRQPRESLRGFLLETSVLEQLSAPLCDALLRRRDSGAVLGRLDRAGAFLVPLDPGRRKFRFQRTVGEFLRSELARVEAESLPRLRHRAAAACERAGLAEEASAHALAAGDARESHAILGRHAVELVRAGRTELFGRLLATQAGTAALGSRPGLEVELEHLAAARSDLGSLLRAAERVTALCAGLSGNPVVALARSAAAAARAYALLLAGRLDEAYAAGSVPEPSRALESSAFTAQATAAASLAASSRGLHCAAAPLARASGAALRCGAVRPGLASALSAVAEAAVLAELGDRGAAERRCCAAAADAVLHPPVRALALLELARHRAAADPDRARDDLEQARLELTACAGVGLLEALARTVEGELATCVRALPAKRELSAAEQRVLRLLATNLTQREIASELYLSPNTVKTHARIIYRKLDVSSRRAAVRAGQELNLV